MVCLKCGIEKPLSEYSTNGVGLYKRRCKSCRSSEQSARYLAKPLEERRLEMKRTSNWVRNNPEKYRIYARKTRERNQEHYRLKVQLRRRRHRIATPNWASQEKIKDVYQQAMRLTVETGVRYEVDHIVPLQNSLVCGLHWEGNLQVISATENRRKNNRHWPDMPDCENSPKAYAL